MTDKQKKTLVLFAQNYSLQVIAKKQDVSYSTIRERIEALSKNHQKEFNNAVGIRESYKRTRDTLRNPMSLDSYLVRKRAKDTAKLLTRDNKYHDIDNIQEVF